MKIGARDVGQGHPCLIVAEVAQAHDGSLGNAHAFIDAVAAAGADAVKFQCHLGDDTDEWRVRPEWPQDKSRQSYWRRTGFTPPQWQGLYDHATARGLIFLASPFSVAAVELLDPLVPAWKVPSGRIKDRALLEAIADTSKPVILSAGMATWGEVYAAERRIRDHASRFKSIGGCPGIVTLLCTSLYPTPADRIGLSALLNGVDGMGDSDFDGISDHSGTVWAGVAAVARGASIVEVHVCWSRQQYGPDTSSSVTVEELRQLVEGVRFTEKALQPVDKDAMARELAPMRRLFMGEKLSGPEYDPEAVLRGGFIMQSEDVERILAARRTGEPSCP